jgi:hypothetical protein
VVPAAGLVIIQREQQVLEIHLALAHLKVIPAGLVVIQRQAAAVRVVLVGMEAAQQAELVVAVLHQQSIQLPTLEAVAVAQLQRVVPVAAGVAVLVETARFLQVLPLVALTQVVVAEVAVVMLLALVAPVSSLLKFQVQTPQLSQVV